MGRCWDECVYYQNKYYKQMSFFRQFNKTICATRFTKPNNLLLARSSTPVFLCESTEPSIDHLNTIKSLLKTIDRLEVHAPNATYQSYVKQQLQMLQNSLQAYVHNCVRYVEMGGRLTGQALANLYGCSEQLGVNPQWLQVYAESEIPHLIRHMSVENLNDLEAGLKRNNGSANFLELVQKQLKTRNQEPYEYVKRAVNEVAVFEYGQAPVSHNLLLRALDEKQPAFNYLWNKFLKTGAEEVSSYLWKRPSGYALD